MTAAAEVYTQDCKQVKARALTMAHFYHEKDGRAETAFLPLPVKVTRMAVK